MPPLPMPHLWMVQIMGFFCPLYLLLLRFMSIFPPNPITQEAQHTAQGIEYHVIHITTAHAAEQLDHFYRDGKLHGKKCCRPEIDRSSADTGQEKSKRGKAYDIAQQVQKYPPGSNRLVILDVTHDLPKRDQIVAILIHCIFPKCLCKSRKYINSPIQRIKGITYRILFVLFINNPLYRTPYWSQYASIAAFIESSMTILP